MKIKTMSGVVKKGHVKRHNGKIADKVAFVIFKSAVPALIERWERYKQDENTYITFDRFLMDIIQNYKESAEGKKNV